MIKLSVHHPVRLMTQVIHFDLTDLALEPWQMAVNSSESLLQPYFVTVKAVTGSGHSVTVSSTGVYIDTTPPIIQVIFHIDSQNYN